MKHSSLGFFVASCAIFTSFASGQTIKGRATISGVVIDDAGAAVANVAVALHGVHRTQRDALGRLSVVGPKRDFSVRSARDGTFRLTELEAGDYELCAVPNQEGFLASCRWGKRSTVVKVATEDTSTTTLVVRRGIRVDFELTDTGQKLGKRARFVLGVMTPGGYYAPASAPSAVAAGQYLASVTVPFGKTLRLFADGELSIAEPSGKDIARGVASLELRVPSDGERLVVPIHVK